MSDDHFHYASEIHDGVTRDEYLTLVRELATARSETRELRQQVRELAGVQAGHERALARPRDHMHAVGTGAICCPVCGQPWALRGHVCTIDLPAAHAAAIAGACSHGGHGWDGDTCSDIAVPS
jgi:hypothetical protein